MTLETPIEVDLSGELTAQKLWEGLTKDEQIKFNEYFNADKEGILYLSQMELSELKRILGEDSSAYIDADFDEFIDEQLNERLSSSDILDGVDGIPESFGDTLDSLSTKALFGEEGIFTNTSLSSKAQDNIITSLSLSVLSSIDVKSLSEEDVIKTFTQAIKNLTTLKELADTSALGISGEGERNYIFMDASVGVKFFDALIAKPMTGNDIQSYINDRNLSPESTTEIINNIRGLTTHSTETIKNLLATVKKDPSTKPETKKPKLDSDGVPETPTTDIDPDDTLTDDEVDEIEKKGGFGAAFIKMLREIFKMIQGVTGSDKKTDSTKKTEKKAKRTEKTPEVIQAEKEELTKLLRGVDESQKNNSLIATLKKGGEKAEEVKTLIEGISPGTSFAQSFTELFKLGENGMSKIDTVSKIFDAQGLSASMPNGSTDLDKKMLFLKEYADYRASEGVTGVESGRIKWKAWAEERKSKDWKRD